MQMMALGFTLARPIEQVQVSLWSTVLRIPTATETLYFKASAPVFAYEPLLTQKLFQFAPASMLDFSPETIARLRDAYLQEWTQFEPLEQLQTAYVIAQRLGKLCRALTWGRLVASLSPDERWEYEGSYPYWLRVFLGTEE